MAERVKLLDPKVVARLGQPVLARFPMVGNVSGLHRSPHRGSSVEFAEYRNYVPGDDLRRLDWRVFARSDRFYMKEFEAETNLRCYLVLDCSASMGFAGNGISKFDYARRMIATLAYVLIHQGDAAGLLCIGEKTISEIPPRRTPGHLKNIMDVLEKAEPQGETGLVAGLHQLAEKVSRRGLVLLFSDFFCEPEPLVSAFQHLRFQKHDLSVFQLLDRMETDFRFDRPVRFLDLENSFSLVTEPAAVREEYLAHLQRFVEGLRKECHKFKADYRQVLTDQDYEKVLADFLVERALSASAAPV